MTRLPASKLPVPLEDDEQMELVSQYLEPRAALGQLKFTAVPNNTYTPHMSQKVKNSKMGLRPGFSDLIVALPHIGLACPEMKRQRGGVQSEAQKEWETVLNTVPGVEYRVCKGWRKAVEFIEELSPSPIGKQLLDQSIF